MRRWRTLLLICGITVFLFRTNSVFADTSITSDITQNTTWTPSESPYVLEGYITVAPDVALTIEPGVVVKIGDSLEVDGILVANGTETNPITFTSPNEEPAPGDWGNFILHSEKNNILTWVTIQYGSGVIIPTGTAVFQNTTIKDAMYGISIQDTSTVDATSFTVSNILYDCIQVTTNSSLSLEGGSIKNCGTDAISIFTNSTALIDSISIDTTQEGLSVFNNANVSFNNSSIENTNSWASVSVFNNSSLTATGSKFLYGSGSGIQSFNNGSVSIHDGQVNYFTEGVYDFGSSEGYEPENLTIEHSDISQNETGILLGDEDTTVGMDTNAIHDNKNFGASTYLTPISNFDLTNNWWGDPSGPQHVDNAGGLGDTVSDGIAFTPFLLTDPIGIEVEPAQYYTKITTIPSSVAVLREAPTMDGNAIKTLPNDWIVKVIAKTQNGQKSIADGYEWYNVLDPTDGTTGWMVAAPVGSHGTALYLPYEYQKQAEYEYDSSHSFNIVSSENNQLRRDTIINAVDHYLNNTDTSPSLYSSDDSTQKISDLSSIFSPELILAILAQESGSTNFDNEFVTFDYGHGVSQVTMNSWKNEPDDYRNNREDNRGLISVVRLLKCQNYFIDQNNKKIGVPDYKNCYKNTSTKNKLTKPYDNYEHILTNPKYKEYTNTVQSIYANIKDGLGVLRQKVSYTGNSCPKPDKMIQGVVFTCEDMQRIKTVWAYNGFGYDKTTQTYTGHYLADVANKLQNLETYFPGVAYDDSDQFIEKLKIADANKKTVKVYSPVELSAQDSEGNITGLYNGEIMEEIPDSIYDPNDESILILFPDSDITYRTVGTETASYGFQYDSSSDGMQVMAGTNESDTLPIVAHAINTYTIDDTALASGGDGVVIGIDTNADGQDEQVVTTGTTITTWAPVIDFSSVKSSYQLGQKLNVWALVYDDITPQADIVLHAFLNNQEVSFINNTQIELSIVGQVPLKIIAIDGDQNQTVAETTLRINFIFTGFQGPLHVDAPQIPISNPVPINFVLKSKNEVLVPQAYPTLSVVRLSDGYHYPVDKLSVDGDPDCDVDDTCFAMVDNRYTYRVPKKKLSLGDWKISVTLADGSIHEKIITIIP